MFIVVMKDDEGNYVLATRTIWLAKEDATGYASAVAQDRHALVVEAPRGVDFRIIDDTLSSISRLTDGRITEEPR